MTIKHIVLPGGGPNMLYLYGIIKQLNILSYWSIDNIESLYCTSCGSMIGLLIMLTKLGLQWELIDNFYINKPWENIFEYNPETIFTIYDKKGLIDYKTFCSLLECLMSAVNIPLTVTLQELYELTHIDFSLSTTNMDTMEPLMLNYISHPSLGVLDAIHMSSAIPIFIQPAYYNNTYYIDGGLFLNDPLENLILKHPDLDNIFGFSVNIEETNYDKLDESSTLLDFIIQLSTKLFVKCNDKINPNYTQRNIDITKINYIDIMLKPVTDHILWKNIITCSKFRQNQINMGENIANQYLFNKFIDK